MLANEKMGRLLFKLSVPAILSMMVHAVYNTVDAIFVGRWVGTMGIGAISVVLPIIMLIMATVQTIGIGGASLISRRMGADDPKGAALALGNMILLAAICGAAIMLAGIFALTPLLRFFGTTEALLPMAHQYFQIIMLAGPGMTLSMVATDAIRAEGNAKVAMLIMMAGAILNIILDPIFIYVLGMGIRGAAIATAISILINCFILVAYFLSGRSEIAIGLRYLRLKFEILKEIILVGSSAFARVGAMSFTVTLLNHILSHHGGDLGIPTFGVLFRTIAFIIMPVMGLTMGMQPIIGFNFGAQKFSRVKQCIKLSMIASTAVSTTGFLVALLFPETIMRAFTSDPELVASGRNALRFGVIFLPLAGMQVVGGGFFQALGKAAPAMLLTLSRQVLALIPMILILPAYFGINGVWLSFPLADAVSFSLTMIFVLKQMKKFPVQDRAPIGDQELKPAMQK
jgi:putative MATE family efflux protein